MIRSSTGTRCQCPHSAQRIVNNQLSQNIFRRPSKRLKVLGVLQADEYSPSVDGESRSIQKVVRQDVQ